MATIPIQISLRKEGEPNKPALFNCSMSENDFEAFKNVMQGKGVLGTRVNPLPIGNFLKKDVINSQEIPCFEWGNALIMEIEGDDIELLFCELRNTNKDFTNNIYTEIDGENAHNWSNIMSVATSSGKSSTPPNGSLFLDPIFEHPNQSAFGLLDSNNPKRLKTDIYISYNIVFSWKLSTKKNEQPKTYYFVHDPVIKVSSNTPPPEL